MKFLRLESLLVGMVFLWLPLSLFTPKVLAPVFALGILAAGVFLLRQGYWYPKKWYAFHTAWLLFMIWAGLSCTWAPEPWLSFLVWLKIVFFTGGSFVVVAAASYLPEKTNQSLKKAFLIGLFMTVSLSLLLLVTHFNLVKPFYKKHFLRDPHFDLGPLFNFASTLLAIGLWPLLHISLKEKRWGVSLGWVVALLAAVFMLRSDSAKLAVLLGGGAWLLQHFLPHRILFKGLGILVFLGVLTSPVIIEFLGTNLLNQTSWGRTLLRKPSYTHRLYIAKETVQQIKDHPWQGQGLDSSRSLFRQKEAKGLIVPEYGEIKDSETARSGLHPHNAALQWWAELGGIGAFLAASFIALFLWHLAQLPFAGAGQHIILATFIGLLSIAHTSYSSWMTIWLASIGFWAFILSRGGFLYQDSLKT